MLKFKRKFRLLKVKQIGCKAVERIHLVQESNQWRGSENSEMGFQMEQTKTRSQDKNEMEKEREEKMTADEKNEGISRSRVLVDTLLIPGIVNNFPAIHRTRRLVTAFTGASHLPCLQAPHPPKHFPEYTL